MGYHSLSKSMSDVIYGQENVAPALRVLDTILSVAVGKFLPDSINTGCFLTAFGRVSSLWPLRTRRTRTPPRKRRLRKVCSEFA